VGRSYQFLIYWEDYSDIEDSWVKEGDIDTEMIRVYFEELEKEKGDDKIYKVDIQITIPSSKSIGGRSVRMRYNRKS
jgi:hypothetical protein